MFYILFDGNGWLINENASLIHVLSFCCLVMVLDARFFCAQQICMLNVHLLFVLNHKSKACHIGNPYVNTQSYFVYLDSDYYCKMSNTLMKLIILNIGVGVKIDLYIIEHLHTPQLLLDPSCAISLMKLLQLKTEM